MHERKAIKSGIWFTASNFLIKGIGFITTPIFTRLLTKAEFGEFNNFTTWVNILLILTSLNLESSLIRARFDFEDDLDEYIFSMQVLSLLSTGIWFLFSVIFRGALRVQPAKLKIVRVNSGVVLRAYFAKWGKVRVIIRMLYAQILCSSIYARKLAWSFTCIS